ncbi:RNA polymerase sigma factor [Filimonas lacunae]|uniref:RNA polymerase sigma factor n=1 Tax=Filimonas lacunae TaxID=477680 RepID=UPI0007D71C1E|nr:RNA polymerase sigma-70 factor [Filimonas lacunae]BAV09285.1 RNA polymerase ECF-type sigma factor [Filimonas lacunae]
MRTEKLHNEPALLQALANGSSEAFTLIFTHYSAGVYDAAMAYLQNENQAQEAVQEVFLKIWQKREQLAEVEKLQDYLFIVARNYIFNQLKHNALTVTVLHQHYQQSNTFSNDTDYRVREKQYQQLLEAAINTLPAERKKIYLLAKNEELSYEQIAQQLGISRHTVKNQMYQALQTIRLYMQQYMPLYLTPLSLTVLIPH